MRARSERTLVDRSPSQFYGLCNHVCALVNAQQTSLHSVLGWQPKRIFLVSASCKKTVVLRKALGVREAAPLATTRKLPSANAV